MANDPQQAAAGARPAASRPHGADPSAPHAHASHLAETERKQSRRLLLVLLLIAVFFVFELMGARAAKSDVLEADAFHLLMDVLALGISLAAMRIARARPSPRFTFGLRRAEPLAALVNGALVLGVCIELTRDAAADLAHATMPKSGLMLVVATAALVVNGLSAWLLHGVMHVGHAHGHDADAHAHGADEDEGPHRRAHGAHLNLRGAWLHLLGDALGSLAAFAAGLLIRFGAPAVVDPIASFVVVAILLVGAYRLLRDAGLVLLDAAPPRLPLAQVKKTVLSHPGVTSVHALHVWSLGTGYDAVTVHVTADAADPDLAARIGDRIRDAHMVEYVTVQVDAPPRG